MAGGYLAWLSAMTSWLMTSWLMTVDGHDWVARDRDGQPGTYDVDWLTGPAGCGVTTGSSDGTSTDEAGMRDAIAGFLAQVDPGTGFID